MNAKQAAAVFEPHIYVNNVQEIEPGLAEVMLQVDVPSKNWSRLVTQLVPYDGGNEEAERQAIDDLHGRLPEILG